jgi:deoxycytidylate deaminase
MIIWISTMLFLTSCFYGTRNVTYTTTPATTYTTTTTPIETTTVTGNQTVVTTQPNYGTKPHVTISYPVGNPYNSPAQQVRLSAHVDYVSYQSDIQLTFNGTASNAWYFNPADGNLSADFTLAPGNNVVVITANNSFGSDAISEYVEYAAPVSYQQNTGGYQLSPQIALVSPSTNPFTSNTNQITVMATMNNVNSMNEIQLKVNGVSSGNFTFDQYSKALQFSAMLSPGNNYLYVMASNAAGSDSKGLMVYYAPPVVVTGNPVLTPVVTLSSSFSNPYLTNSSNVNVSATVDNVYDKNQITVMVNGRNVPNFGYSPASKQVQFSVLANAGNNYVYIRATNQAGSDSKSLNVVYTPPSLPSPSISFTNPVNSPYVSPVNSVIVDAIIDNVNNWNQIQVDVNGVNYTNFNYFPASRKIEFSAFLNPGGNRITVGASNNAGQVHKDIIVVYTPPAVNKPVITITNPISNPFNTGSGSVNISAHVFYIGSQNDIQVKLNGVSHTNFVYNSSTQEVQFNTPLAPGINTVTISASNSGGADSKNLTVVYTPAPNKPVVVFQNPNTTPFVTASANISLLASVSNVNSQNDILLKFNGMNRTDFTYNAASHQVQFNPALSAGNNYIFLSASNSSGTDVKSVDVVYNAPQIVPKPTVTLLNPSVNPYTSPVQNTTVMALVMNVNSQNDIQVKVNGAPFTNFIYDQGTHDVKFNTTLNPGNNYIYIAANNSAGSDNKSFDVIFSPPIAARPVVTIINPGRTPFLTAVNTLTIQASVMNVGSKNEIEVLVNGAASNFNYNPVNHIVDLYMPLHAGKNEVSVVATNGGGSDRKDQEIDYTSPVIGNGTGNGLGNVVPKPVVNIVNPNTNPFTITVATFTLNAFVQYVSSANDIHITQDNNPVSGFSFNPGSQALNLTTALHPGINNFVITGTNGSGTDSKTLVVNHIPAPPTGGGGGIGSAPVITVTSPTQPGYNTVDPNFPVTATVTNVTGSFEIKVNINSVSVPFVYDQNTKILTIKGYLQIGPDDIHITATNNVGTDSKTISMRLSHGTNTPVNPAPIVNIINPYVDPTTTSDQNFTLTGNVQFVNGSSDIHVTNNGANVPFTFDANTKQFSVRGIHNDMNNFVVSATNGAGTSTKTARVNLVPSSIGNGTGIGVGGGTGIKGGPVVLMPTVSFMSPSGNPAMVNTYSTAVSVMVTGINSVADVAVKVNNAPYSTGLTYNPATHILTFTPNLVPAANTIEVKATNLRGSDVKVLNIMSSTKGINQMRH